MLYEIDQIKRFLAEKYNLPYTESRIDGVVPDGEHTIPLGASLTPTRVVIRDNRIYIDPVDEPTIAENPTE